MPGRDVRKKFDHAFFSRYYYGPTSAAVRAGETRRLCRFVLAYLEFLSVDVKTVLDAGCGTGMWKKALAGRRVSYAGIDTSEYLCRKYGWKRSAIADFKSRRKYDLVVCQDVLQYLGGAEVERSVDNIARLCRGAVYVQVPTRDDFADGTVDMKETDVRIHLRGARWYRRILSRHFTAVGGGVFVPNRDREFVLALERI